MPAMDISAAQNTPLAVNFLRLVRNARLPRARAEASLSPDACCFVFGGLRMPDSGPFKAAESVWATLSSRVDDRGGCGSRFTGPLHMLVRVDGATVEHWTVRDGREDHTENAVPRNYDQVEALNAIVRILFTQLRGGDVFAAVRRREALEDDRAALEEASASPSVSDGGEGVVRGRGVELVVLGDDAVHSTDADGAAYGGLQAALREEEGRTAWDRATARRYRSRTWEEDGLVHLTCVTDTLWQTATVSRASPLLESEAVGVAAGVATPPSPASFSPHMDAAHRSSAASLEARAGAEEMEEVRSAADVTAAGPPPDHPCPADAISARSVAEVHDDTRAEQLGSRGSGGRAFGRPPIVLAQGKLFPTGFERVREVVTAASLHRYCELLAQEEVPYTLASEALVSLLE